MARQQNVLIVGGAGYIGSHTTLALKDAGFGSVVYDDLSAGHADACFGDAFVKGDILDTEKLTRTLIDHDIGCVVHFAARIEAGQSVIDPLPFYRNNVAGSVSLLDAMKASDVKRIVFSSTAAVYGNAAQGGSLSEDLPRAPINPYGQSKAMVERALEECARAYGMSAIALRYFNAAGADPQGRCGERHDPETHLIPLVIEAARGIRPQIYINGTDYDTPDGTCVRDYIHVSDLASGHVAAVKQLLGSDVAGFEPINLGTGTGISVSQVIAAVRDVAGVEFKVVERARREGDPAVLVADVAKAQKVLGWSAQQSSIEEIVKTAWDYALSDS
jgi:UDP-glucose-4-epimerase GalE